MKERDKIIPISNECDVPINMNIEQAARYLNTTPRQLRDLV